MHSTSRPIFVLLFSLVYMAWMGTTSARPMSPQNGEEAANFWTTLGRMAATDVDAARAARFPHIPAEQRPHIGTVPQNLWGLITGADRDGRLTLRPPQRGHALLFTTDIPEGKRVADAGNVGSPAQPATATSRTVRGVGMVTLPDGRQRYFRTVPFDPSPLWSPRSRASRAQGVIQDHVPPRSFEKDPFGSRRITVAGPDTTWKVKEKVPLAHIHTMPLGGGLGESVYPDDVLAEVIRGPEGRARLVEWEETPKGSKASKSKKWLSSWPSRSRDRGAASSSSSSS